MDDKRTETIHGGDVYRNQVDLDFSVNTNPSGMPGKVKEALKKAIGACTLYPDMEWEQLGEALGKAKGVKREQILFGNGASELFMAVCHALMPEKCVLPIPSFYGYQRALWASGTQILYYPLKKERGFALEEGIFEVLTNEVDMLFLTNPNNPVGNGIPVSLLREILTWCRKRGIIVVLDECFIDFVENGQTVSLIEDLERFDNLILVQAFTKIYAMPGLRLGCLFSSNEAVREKIRAHLPEWNVSVPALEGGLAALSEEDYIEKSVQYVKKEREYLKQELVQMGITVYPSCTVFLLLETKIPLYKALLEEKILIRDCSNFKGLGKGFYRIAVRTRAENEMLLRTIRKLAEN